MSIPKDIIFEIRKWTSGIARWNYDAATWCKRWPIIDDEMMIEILLSNFDVEFYWPYVRNKAQFCRLAYVLEKDIIPSWDISEMLYDNLFAMRAALWHDFHNLAQCRYHNIMTAATIIICDPLWDIGRDHTLLRKWIIDRYSVEPARYYGSPIHAWDDDPHRQLYTLIGLGSVHGIKMLDLQPINTKYPVTVLRRLSYEQYRWVLTFVNHLEVDGSELRAEHDVSNLYWRDGLRPAHLIVRELSRGSDIEKLLSLLARERAATVRHYCELLCANCPLHSALAVRSSNWKVEEIILLMLKRIRQRSSALEKRLRWISLHGPVARWILDGLVKLLPHHEHIIRDTLRVKSWP